jgi:hypothetical protein
LRWLARTGVPWRRRPHDLPPARDDERLPQTPAGLHVLAFALLLLARFAAVLSERA